LANGARLTEIYTHYVVLERDGRSVRLYLQGEPQQPNGESDGRLLTVGGTAAPAPVVVDSHNSLTAYLRPSPVFVGTRLHGYALYPGKDPTPFSRLGLEPGDVVTGIDGIPVTRAADSLATLRTLADGAALTVTIERQSKPQTLSLDGALLAHAIAATRDHPAAPATTFRDDFKIDPAPVKGKVGL
jgi:type II secretion system protein C